MFYYTVWGKDTGGKWHRTIAAYTKEQPRMRKSVFAHTAYWFLIPTTKEVYLSYRRKLEEVSSYCLYADRDFRGIRYREVSIWTDEGLDISMEYFYNRHQRKRF